MKTIAVLKATILQSVAETDDQALLMEIQNHIDEILSRKKVIVGYNASGAPLTLEEYQSQVAEAQEDYKAGKFISHDDLEKEL